jgi:NADH-quinone oxidoreductase subunit N
MMFSLAGIPPLLGFWPKLLVFSAATSAGLFPLAVIAAVSSVIGAYYYLRIIKVMYFDAPAAPFRPVQDYAEAGIILVSSIVMLVGYWLIPVLANTSGAAAKALF